MIHAVAIDFETTSKDTTEAHPIEFGLASADDGAWFHQSFIALPEGVTIPPETSAVHHIVDEDIRGAPYWPETLVFMRRLLELDGTLDDLVLVAHNAEYEQGTLANTEFAADKIRWICTFKCALVAFPDAPSHSNEALRYWLKVGSNRGRSGATGAHSALHDAKVTAGLYHVLYGWFYMELVYRGVIPRDADATGPVAQEAVIEEMVRVSREIAQLPNCPIGKERGKKWEDIDAGFLSWCLRQPDMREDVKHAATRELERRRNRGPGRGR